MLSEWPVFKGRLPAWLAGCQMPNQWRGDAQQASSVGLSGHSKSKHSKQPRTGKWAQNRLKYCILYHFNITSRRPLVFLNCS